MDTRIFTTEYTEKCSMLMRSECAGCANKNNDDSAGSRKANLRSADDKDPITKVVPNKAMTR